MKTRTKLFALLMALAMLVSVVAVFPAVAVEGDGAWGVGDATYATLPEAVAAVEAGGTIRLLSDVTISARINLTDTTYLNKNYTIDGGIYDAEGNLTGKRTITDANAGQDIIKFGSSSSTATITVQNLKIASNYGKASLFLGDGAKDHLVVSGCEFTCASSVTTWNTWGVLMFGGGTMTVENSTFAVPGAAVSFWGGSDRTLNLNEGNVLCCGSGYYVVDDGYGVSKGTNVININALPQVNDYSYTPPKLRGMYETDICSAIASKTVTLADGVAWAVPATAYITIGEDTYRYETLEEAVEAAETNDVLTVTGELITTAAVTLADKDLTLKGAEAGGRVVGGNHALLVLHNATLTVESLTMTCASTSTAGVISMGGAAADTAYTGATVILNDGAQLRNTATSGSNTGGNGVVSVAAGNGQLIMNEGSSLITGGTAIKGDGVGFNIDVQINGGKVASSNRGICVNNCTANIVINGGELSSGSGQWLISTYSATAKIVINGGTLTSAGNFGGTIGENTTIQVNGGKIVEKNVVLFSAPDFKTNYMYLHMAEAPTTANSGMGFATKVEHEGGSTVEYGMLLLPSHILGDAELTLDTENVLKITDAALTENGYIDTAVIGLSANAMSSAMVGRAYVTVTCTLGGKTVTKTFYGDVMTGTAEEFAQSFLDANAELTDAEQAVVDYFASAGVTA